MLETIAVKAASGRRRRIAREWPTWVALAACYGVWLAASWNAAVLGVFLWPVLALTATFHSSLQHEALHGHPTRSAAINEALVFPALQLAFPYRRFRDTHLRHHNDENLTDPHDDPESWYLAERDWDQLSPLIRRLLDVNATLLGRIVLGPALAVFAFWRADFRAIACGDREIRTAWMRHGAGAALALGWIWGICGINPLAYAAFAAYPSLSLLMVRTYAEHTADMKAEGRVSITPSGPFWSLLFLNNNLHATHHANPRAPWASLPALRRAEGDRGALILPGYRSIFARHLLRRRQDVPHPFLRRRGPG